MCSIIPILQSTMVDVYGLPEAAPNDTLSPFAARPLLAPMLYLFCGLRGSRKVLLHGYCKNDDWFRKGNCQEGSTQASICETRTCQKDTC